MDLWQRLWQRLIKDIVLTGIGGWAIVSQIQSPHPSELVMGIGLALTVPSVADHVRALLPSSGPPATSEPGPGSPSEPDSPQQGGTDA